MKKVILDKAKIGYIHKGKKGKPKILMLHGLFSNCRYFDETISFIKNDFEIIAPDFPGFGLSDKLKTVSHTLESYSESIIQLCDHLDFKPFNLIGASLGGMVGIKLASDYDEYISKVIIQAAPWNKSCINMRIIEKTFDFASRMEKLVNVVDGLKNRIKKETLTKTLKMFNKHYYSIEERNGCISYSFKRMNLKATSQIWNNLKDAELSEKAKRIEKKTLVIAGDHDEIVFPEKTKMLAEFIKDSEFRLIKGIDCTHALFFDHPDKMARLIKSFF